MNSNYCYSKLLILFVALVRIESLFIGNNFNDFLSSLCSTRSRIFLLIEIDEPSLVRQHLTKSHCLHYLRNIYALSEQFAEEITLMEEIENNILIEINVNLNISSINLKVFSGVFSMNVNFVIVVKNELSISRDLENKIFNYFLDFRCYIIKYDQNLKYVNVFYVRPVVNGCHSFNGILHSSDPNVKAMMTSSDCNLNGTLLTIAANIVSETFTFTQLNICCHSVYHIQILYTKMENMRLIIQ